MTNKPVDIVIVGGGIAGFSAALSAAETRSVVLIDKSAQPGGATTQTNVGTLCGLYYRTSTPQIIEHPFCKSFVERLYKYDPKAKLVSMPDDLHVIAYEWSNLQQLFVEQLEASKVKVLLNTEVTAIQASETSIREIQVKNENGVQSYQCKAVVDCSGNGYVAQKLGHDMIREESYQAASQVIRLKNVQAANEYSLNMALKKTIVKNSPANNWPRSYASLSVVPGSLSDSKVDLKLPLSGKISDGETQADLLKKEIVQHLNKLVKAFREVESLSQASVERVFPSPGIRIQQRPKGQNILTEKNVMNAERCRDGIALGTWPIEEWDYNGKVKLDFINGERYMIPSGCLVSPSLDNLFFAGKGISAETRAIASARVTGTCLQTGYAAGKIAGARTSDDRTKVIESIHATITAEK